MCPSYYLIWQVRLQLGARPQDAAHPRVALALRLRVHPRVLVQDDGGRGVGLAMILLHSARYDATPTFGAPERGARTLHPGLHPLIGLLLRVTSPHRRITENS